MAPMAVASFRTRVVAARTAAELSLKLPLTILGVAWLGIEGALWARGIAGLFGAIAALEGAKRLTGLALRDQARALIPVLLGLLAFSIVVGTLSLPFFAAVSASANASRITLAAVVIAIAAAGLAVQWITTFGLWRLTGCPPGAELRLARLAHGYWAGVRQRVDR
jgi:hypothetical protein